MSLVEKNKGPGYKTSKYGIYRFMLKHVRVTKICNKIQKNYNFVKNLNDYIGPEVSQSIFVCQ